MSACPICEDTGVDLSTFVPANYGPNLATSEAEPCPNGCPYEPEAAKAKGVAS